MKGFCDWNAQKYAIVNEDEVEDVNNGLGHLNGKVNLIFNALQKLNLYTVLHPPYPAHPAAARVCKNGLILKVL